MSKANPFAEGCAHVAGAFVPISQAGIPIRDFGFLRSDATYDVVHVWDGAFFRLDVHLDRFFRNIERLRMTCPISRETVSEVLIDCVRKSGLRQAYVEAICTRGEPPPQTRNPRDAVNRFFAFAAPFVPYANEDMKRRGLHVVIGSNQRIPPESVDPTIKNYHWHDLTAGLFEAQDRGADNVVLLDRDGNLTEGPGFNVFCVEEGRVLTPRHGVLDGITRRTALELCAALEIPCAETDIPAERFIAADEVFITSTAGGIMAVTRVESRILGNGAPGAVTNRLADAYLALHRDESYLTRVPYDD
ncbi:MAG: aminotransferase class IV [Proteobacteria bacterium]|nr:aminotransferase class IV [Pseudomonadota bacterium]MDA1057161.1 aminotransferase class IV [Pseudomonadota bacterium]